MILQLISASFGLIVSTSRNHHNLAQPALSGYQSLLRKRAILLAPTEILPTRRIVELDGLAIHPLSLLRPPRFSRPFVRWRIAFSARIQGPFFRRFFIVLSHPPTELYDSLILAS